MNRSRYAFKKKRYYKSSWRKENGLPLYVVHERTGMKFTLFGIKNKSALLKDLNRKGFKRISFREYYRRG